MKRILAFLVCLMLALTWLPSAPAQAAEAPGAEMLDEIIIKFYDRERFPKKEKQYDDELAKILKDGLSQVTENVYVVKAEDLSKNPNAILNIYKNSEFIEYVEPNYVANAELAPNDPDYITYTKRGLSGLHLEQMWDIVNTVSTVVAVLDTGVYAAHPEFGGRVYTGYDFVNNMPSATTDDNGHGTRVAGVIAAQGNNGAQVAGINWGANVLPVKVLDSKGKGTVANIAKGIRWAADNGAKIINMSLGCTSDSITLKSAVDYAVGKGCILVAAAGNTGLGTMEYPAKYDNVIGVGADTGTGDRASYSCYGLGLDIIAVGTYRTTTMAGGTGSSSGTSFASPQVAAVLSLVMEYYPNLDSYSAKELIKAAASNKGTAGWTETTGYGYLDYQHFVLTAQGLGTEQKPQDTTPPVLVLKGQQEVQLTEGETYQEPGWAAEDDTDGRLDDFVVVTGTVSTAYAGTYTLTYTVFDKAGNVAVQTRTVTVLPLPEPPADVPVAPTLTPIGSNPIILHLGGTPYTEQGAIAFDNIDGDISDKVVIDSNVDTSAAGVYRVKYTVVNSAGLEATAEREVQVLAPQERYADRTPYNFNGQGKSGASFKYKVYAEESGIMTLATSGLSKTTIVLSVVDENGNQVFGQTCTSNDSWDFWVSEGEYTVSLQIKDAKGNAKVGLSLLMPEVLEVYYAAEEIPIDELPQTGEAESYVGLYICGAAISGAGLFLLLKKRKSRQ